MFTCASGSHQGCGKFTVEPDGRFKDKRQTFVIILVDLKPAKANLAKADQLLTVSNVRKTLQSTKY